MRKMLISQCKYCNSKFKVKPWSIKRGWGIFCSRKCHYLGARKGRLVECDICKKKSYRSPTKLNHSKSGKFFCSKSCQTKWRNGEFVGSRHKLWKDGSSTYRDVIIKAGILKKCTLCHIGDRRVLAVHHKDQNRKNYNLDNLMWLCHNCHHRVHHGGISIN